MKTDKSVLRIYACGGAGVNIAKQLQVLTKVESDYISDIDTCYIDTSKSNMDSTISDDSVFLFEGLDGSGKVRSDNYEVISQNALKILKEFPSGDFNIVISSASGGSGSVIAPVITNQLLKADKLVVVILIGVTDSKIDLDNTIKTIKSYAGVSASNEKPICMSYFENSSEVPRKQIDASIVSVVGAMSILLSGMNEGLDSRDLYNFLNFNRVTSYGPQLATLTVHTGSFPQQIETDSVISVSSIAVSGSEVKLPLVPDYRCDGFISDKAGKDIIDNLPFFFVLQSGFLEERTSDLTKLNKELDQARLARVKAKPILEYDEPTTGDGLVL